MPRASELAALQARLLDLAEPTALRQRLRDLARTDTETAQSEANRLLAAWIWRRWHDELVPYGCAPRDLRALLARDRRDLWLWVMGDRPFPQLIEGIVGRTMRRLFTSPPLS